ncbi:MAG: hypothetical protein QS748_00300 [Candidatus Endonucleobacter bathymodioli]|uniref:DNA replication terminus site-binding protein n=1 Tax=Candidatus Endonucleibacter bathymodioli TaxID=539814 RepID=A0AA90NR47_9GAMM|nr:hypothetical protein [Candidatus Endonucleobacter bathymodioli]
MSKETAAKIAVRDSLVNLIAINQTFKEALLADSDLPLWIMKEDLPTQQRQQTDRAIVANTSTRLTYLPDQSRQETARLPGLVGISNNTYKLGAALNEARNDFKLAMREYRHLFGDNIESIEQTSEKLRENLLGGLKIQHIHFVQSYRQLKLFESPPKRVGFSWAACHSGSVRLNTTDAIDHLKQKYLASGSIDSDIRVLEKMPTDQVIIIKRVLAPHLRANLTWPKTITDLLIKDPYKKKQYPNQINTPLPLFVKLQPSEPLPEHNQIQPFNPQSKQDRLRRSDARLEKISTNPHSRIYRHAEPCS